MLWSTVDSSAFLVQVVVCINFQNHFERITTFFLLLKTYNLGVG